MITHLPPIDWEQTLQVLQALLHQRRPAAGFEKPVAAHHAVPLVPQQPQQVQLQLQQLIRKAGFFDHPSFKLKHHRQGRPDYSKELSSQFAKSGSSGSRNATDACMSNPTSLSCRLKLSRFAGRQAPEKLHMRLMRPYLYCFMTKPADMCD